MDAGTLPAGTSAPESVDVPNLAFYPAFESNGFRAIMGFGNTTVPDDRIVTALGDAIIQVNRQLHSWKLEQETEGHTALGDVPSDTYGADPDDETELQKLYRQAVHCYAKADLLEQYRNYSSTRQGNDKADELEETADEFRARAHRAVRLIQGKTANHVELI